MRRMRKVARGSHILVWFILHFRLEKAVSGPDGRTVIPKIEEKSSVHLALVLFLSAHLTMLTFRMFGRDFVDGDSVVLVPAEIMLRIVIHTDPIH